MVRHRAKFNLQKQRRSLIVTQLELRHTAYKPDELHFQLSAGSDTILFAVLEPQQDLSVSLSLLSLT
jgi:hypothetical protein